MLLLLSGFLGYAVNPTSPWNEILAALFGIGAGLTLDEFALWIHLRDVYWTEEGRSSFDAVVVAAVIGGLVVLGFAPFDLAHNGSSITTARSRRGPRRRAGGTLSSSRASRCSAWSASSSPSSFPVGALRLASPHSPWARRFYGEGAQSSSARKRGWRRIEHRRGRIIDAVAGAPTPAEPGAPHESGVD